MKLSSKILIFVLLLIIAAQFLFIFNSPTQNNDIHYQTNDLSLEIDSLQFPLEDYEIYNLKTEPLKSIKIDKLELDSVWLIEDSSSYTLYSKTTSNVMSAKGVDESILIEELMNKYNIDEFEFLSVHEAYESFKNNLELSEFDDDLKCKMAWKTVKRNKCSTKKKYAKQLVKKSNYGNIDFKNGKVVIEAPKISKFQNEVNKLNVLITVLYERRLNLCNVKDYCDQNYILYACSSSGEIPKEVKEIYSSCLVLYKNELDKGLISTLNTLMSNIEKFENGDLTEENVKSIMDSKFKTIENKIDSTKTT